MPFTFGSAGGSVVTDTAGVVQRCAAGCGRVAITTLYGLNMCQFCENNLHAQERSDGEFKSGAAAQAFIISNRTTVVVHH